MSFKVLSSGQVLVVYPDENHVMASCHWRGVTRLPQLCCCSAGCVAGLSQDRSVHIQVICLVLQPEVFWIPLCFSGWGRKRRINQILSLAISVSSTKLQCLHLSAKTVESQGVLCEGRRCEIPLTTPVIYFHKGVTQDTRFLLKTCCDCIWRCLYIFIFAHGEKESQSHTRKDTI